MSQKLTPMMQQFFDVKNQYPDAIILFRCGDFYETYDKDAEVAAEILGITLTKRSSKDTNAPAMAGFPHHALDTYLPKLVRTGLRVAICDQLEDPKLTKKLVKRGITELVTPGVSTNDSADGNGKAWFVEIMPGRYAFRAGGETVSAVLKPRGASALEPGFGGLETVSFRKRHAPPVRETPAPVAPAKAQLVPNALAARELDVGACLFRDRSFTLRRNRRTSRLD